MYLLIKTRWQLKSAAAAACRARHRPHRQRADAAAQQQTERVAVDPYAELKTRVHHACIAKLGPELFTAETTGDLSERVLRAVTEQLALDRTADLPRRWKRSIRRLNFVCAKTGSIMPWRLA